MKIHIGFIKEGTILHFPNSVYDYMKVCDRNGIGGVVNLSTGLYISTSDLEKEGLSPMIDYQQKILSIIFDGALRAVSFYETCPGAGTLSH